MRLQSCNHRYVTIDMKTPLQRIVAQLFIVSMFYGTAIASIQGITVFGKELRGWVWVFHCVTAVVVIMLFGKRRNIFPAIIFMPWIVWVVVRCGGLDSVRIQRMVMLIAPVLVAIASSMIHATSGRETTNMVKRLLLHTSVIILCIFTADCMGWLPPGLRYIKEGAGMTLCFTGTYYAYHAYRLDYRGMFLWGVSIACALVTGMRTITLVLATSLALMPDTTSLYKRYIACALCILILVTGMLVFPGIFNKIQSGEASNGAYFPSLDEMNFSGRDRLWSSVYEGAMKHPVLGGGGFASSDYIFYLYGDEGHGGHPHNDYLRVFFDYGVIGLVFWLAATVYFLVKAWENIRMSCCDTERLWWVLSCGGLLSMVLLSITDNAIVYNAFIGDIVFFFLGGAYSLRAQKGVAD